MGRCWSVFLGISFVAASAWAEDVVLRVEPNVFPEPSSVHVAVDAGLVGDDEEDSAISGQLVLSLLPTAVNPETAQIKELFLSVDDAVRFRLQRFLFSLTASAEAGALQLQLVEPALPEPILNDEFDQFESLIGVGGLVTTSVSEEPLDLSEQPPALVDLEDIAFDADRQAVSIAASIDTNVSVPVNAGGINGQIDILLQGTLVANGAIPAAEYAWSVEGQSAGDYGQPSAWTRNGVEGTDSLPGPIDSVVFHTEQNVQTAIELGDRVVKDVEFAPGGSFRLDNGRLDVSSGQIMLESHLRIAEDAALVSDVELQIQTSTPELPRSILLEGEASALHLANVAMAGTGEVESLQVSPEARILSRLDESEPLKVRQDLRLDGLLEIVPGMEPSNVSNPMTLLEYGAIEIGETTKIAVRDSFLNRQPDGSYLGHVESGAFYAVDFESQRAVLQIAQAESGDTDGDGLVTFADFITLSIHFGQAGDWEQGDFDGNGMVDFTDFIALSNQFGVATTSVPAPSSGWLAGLGMLTLFRVRRRLAKKKGPSTCHSAWQAERSGARQPSC